MSSFRYTGDEPDDEAKSDAKIALDVLGKFLKDNPEVYNELKRQVDGDIDTPRVELPMEEQKRIVDEWRAKAKIMNDKQYGISGERPFRIAAFKGSLCDPETGEPVVVIGDMREDDFNIIGEKLRNYALVPAISGEFQDLLLEYGESERLFKKIPEHMVVDLMGDTWDYEPFYDMYDVEIDTDGEDD
jgi:hypothetical protein